jgi:hypothetical protein|eukprot:COSAG06_NODE_51_length_28373_cov_30.746021_18_plen_63_part_00
MLLNTDESRRDLNIKPGEGMKASDQQPSNGSAAANGAATAEEAVENAFSFEQLQRSVRTRFD